MKPDSNVLANTVRARSQRLAASHRTAVSACTTTKTKHVRHIFLSSWRRMRLRSANPSNPFTPLAQNCSSSLLLRPARRVTPLQRFCNTCTGGFPCCQAARRQHGVARPWRSAHERVSGP